MDKIFFNSGLLILLRKKADLSQHGLATSIGVNMSTIVAVERGKNNPGLYAAYKIANHFNMKIEDFIIK